MQKHHIFFLSIVLCLVLIHQTGFAGNEQVNPIISAHQVSQTVSNEKLSQLQAWLDVPENDRTPIDQTGFAELPLTKEEARQAQDLLWDDHVKSVKTNRTTEWEQKKFISDKYSMKYETLQFGQKPVDGWSLYISLHGGGGAPAEVNESQWKNQIALGKQYKPDEGIYLAPRASTNEWNLWHLPHIDDLLDRIISTLTVLQDVNPNRVYVMGYSAGGDGVYQLAPRMADRWAAASMMAGHPNDAKPDGVRNIGMTLHVGALDSAYNRNTVILEWKKQLEELQANDPEGYQHDVQVHEGKGHWMDMEDRVAVPWMAKFTRNPLPDRIVWRQDDVTHLRFYWLAVGEKNAKPKSEVIVQKKEQTFTIEKAKDIQKLIFRINDDMVDMDAPITIRNQERILFQGIVPRTIKTLRQTIQERGDHQSIFCGEIESSVTTDVENWSIK